MKEEQNEMAVKITISVILGDIWGADECLTAGSKLGLIELLEEDLSLFWEDVVENGNIKIEKVEK